MVEPPATCGGCRALSLRSTFSPAQPWAGQTRPFPQAAMASPRCSLPSSLVLSFLGRWTGVFCDLRWMQASIPAVALAMARRDCSKVRQTTSRTDAAGEPSRDRVLQFIHRLSSKAPSHLRHPSWRSQAVTGSCGSPLAEQRRPSAFDLLFWCARSASKRGQQPSSPYRFNKMTNVM